MNHAVVLALGAPAAQAAAEIADELRVLASAAIGETAPPCAREWTFRLEAIFIRLDQVTTYLDRDLAAIGDLRAQVASAPASPHEDEQAAALLTRRLLHLDGARRSLLRSRALLLDLLSIAHH